MISDAEDLGDAVSAEVPETARVVIIGAGFAGIGVAVRLKQAGIEDFVLLERELDPGGTWRDNTYPGVACDIPSMLYSFSFAPNPRWSHGYSDGGEILAYLREVIREYDLVDRIRYGRNVVGLDFDEGAGVWRVRAAIDGGEEVLEARSVVMATGPLSTASLPSIDGIEDYRGHTVHSAHWNPDLDVTGMAVAVIGTGASAVQIVPELVERADRVAVFQRTPGWVLPRPQYRVPDWARAMYQRLPLTEDLARTALFWVHEVMGLGVVWPTRLTTLLELAARLQLRIQVDDKWTRRQLTPDYRAGCKRLLVSNTYLPALSSDKCKLYTFPIVRLTERGIQTVEGVEHRFDAIVFATGFEVIGKTGTPFPVRGRGGRLLGDEWAERAYAYKSVHVSGYPNLHFTFGPNSGPGHNSALVYLEAQIDYIVESMKMLERWGLRYLDVRETAQDRFNADLQRRLSRTTWNSGCASWYLTAKGFNPTMFPGLARQFRNQMEEVALSDYHAVA